MKKIFHTSRSLFFTILIIGLTAISAIFIPSARTAQSPTPTPPPSETARDVDLLIGSTDGTMLWATIIVLIIILPILWHQIQEKREEKQS